MSWDLDLCKDVQCKPNQVCLIQKSRKSAICVLRKSINRKKAQSKKDAKWSNNSKKLTHKVSASINKSNNQVKSWDSSYLPSSFPSTLSSSSVAPFDKTKPWKDCRPCPVTKPAFYCGTDNSTYSSMCRLQFHNCVHETDVEVACKGFCPCGSPVNVHTRTKEVRNHERWNKYMDTLSKLRRSHKVEKFVRNRAKVALEYTGLYHDGVDGKKSLKKQIAICTKEELKTMGDRLSDWFAVVLRDQKRSQLNKKETFLDYITSPDCPKDIANMFHRLDTDEDLRLSLKELYDLEHDKREKCLKQYLDGCDEDRDTFLNPYEWCSCFDRKSKLVFPTFTEFLYPSLIHPIYSYSFNWVFFHPIPGKPCLIEKSQRKKVYDEFVPKCDKDGFYQPIQCHLHKCWCVDRYGIEIENTRQTEIPDCGKYSEINFI